MSGFRYFAIAQLALCVISFSSFVFGASGDEAAVNLFRTKVWPILATRCLDCHSESNKESGLSLAAQASLLEGGSRGPAVQFDDPLGSPLVTMIQADAHPRMPFEQPALSSEEIETITEWVVAGAHYAEADAASVRATRWRQRIGKIANEVSELAYAPIETPVHVFQGIPFWPIVIGFPALVVVLWLTRRVRPSWKRLGHPALLLVCVLVPAGVNLALLLKHYRASLDSTSSLGMQHQVHMLFGNPPVPVNMHTDNALERTYYRGNDERDERLFNNGHYLTCRFDVGLVDAAGAPVVHGSQLASEDDLYFRYVITRGAHTADVLFDSEMMSGVFLSSKPDMYSCRQSPDTVYLKELEPERLWAAQLPVGIPTDGNSRELVLYVWQRHKNGTKEYLPKVHYAANVRLSVKDGVVQPDSTIWFNALRVTQPIMNFTIPSDEWLSSTPIPELPYATTEDPELLGIIEHRGTAIQ